MFRRLKCLFCALGVILSILVIGDFCQKQTRGFRLQRCIPHPPILCEEPCAQLPSSDLEKVRAILAQPFYFLKKGQQCFAFLSQDGHYVLKLFRWDKLQPSFYDLPQKRKAKEEKRISDFTSYKIAYEELQEETGLIYLQLSQASQTHASLVIYDNLSIRHEIPADATGFILQKKAEPFYPYFLQCLSSGKTEQLPSFFCQLATILQKRAAAHILDTDISLEYNLGILDGKPLLFDIGNLRKQPAPIEEQSSLLLHSLQKISPPWEANFKEKLF